MADLSRNESAEQAALRVCNEMKEMILTAKLQAAAAIGRPSQPQHGNPSVGARHAGETDGSRSTSSELKLQDELEDTKKKLNRALAELAIAQREIEAKDKQIVALLRRMPTDSAGDSQDLRSRLQQEQVTSDKLRQELESARLGNGKPMYATYDA